MQPYDINYKQSQTDFNKIHGSQLQQQMAHDAQKMAHENDPAYEYNKFKALQDMITGGNQGTSANSTNPTIEALKKNPLLRGFFKHKFGYDPLLPPPETPNEKRQADLDLFTKKQNIKNQGKGGDVPTTAVLTQNQQAIQGVDSSLPILDELINDKNLPGIMSFSPGNNARYSAKTGAVIDTLVAAQNLPKVQESIKLVEQQIRRHAGETVHDYKARLRDLKKDLIARRTRSVNVLKSHKVNSSQVEDFSSMSDEELNKIAEGG